MNWYLAKSLVKLRGELNAAFPERSKISDGSVGDLRHQHESRSDHNPNKAGAVTAIDVTNDTEPNEPGGQKLADALYSSKDKRIKYLIWNKRITNKVFGTGWKPYHGANPHQHHVHISVSADRKLYDDEGAWNLNFDDNQSEVTPPPPPCARLLKRGSKGTDVSAMQNKLVALFYLKQADGDFGAWTEKAVESFQKDNHLAVDGKAGTETLTTLEKACDERRRSS